MLGMLLKWQEMFLIISVARYMKYIIYIGNIYSVFIFHMKASYIYIMYESVKVFSCSLVSDTCDPHGLKLTRLLCPWNSPGKNTRVGSQSLLQGSSWPRNQNWVSCIAGRFFTIWGIREALLLSLFLSILIHFGAFIAIVVTLISFLGSSLLIYINTIDFWISIFNTTTLLNLFINSNHVFSGFFRIVHR